MDSTPSGKNTNLDLIKNILSTPEIISSNKLKLKIKKYIKLNEDSSKTVDTSALNTKTKKPEENNEDDNLSSSSESESSNTTYSEISFFQTNVKGSFGEKIPKNKNYLSDIFKEINQLKTTLDENQSKIDYPLELNEIFPKLQKFEINTKYGDNYIETPIDFLYDFLFKNYNESSFFSQNKEQLHKYKYSKEYKYKTMEQYTINNNNLEKINITCVIIGSFRINNIDKNNNEITKLINDIKKNKNNILWINSLFIGYENGLINQYVLYEMNDENKKDNFRFYRNFYVSDVKEQKNIEKHVLCMSLSPNENFLLAGYTSSNIILFDTNDGKIIKNFNTIFDVPVVACNLISVTESENNFLFLASDLMGKVRLIEYTKNTFVDNNNIIIVSNYSFPCFLLGNLNNNIHKQFKEFNVKNNIDSKGYICFIGSLENMELIKISKFNKNIQSLINIKNPDHQFLMTLTENIKKCTSNKESINLLKQLNNTYIPDVAFGKGYIDRLFNEEENQIENDELYIIFIVSWGNEIKLYYFSKELTFIKEFGNYFNNSAIIKVGFIDYSLIYFIDVTHTVKILNTNYFNPITIIASFKNNFFQKKNINIKNQYFIPANDIISLDCNLKQISKSFIDAPPFYNYFIINNIGNLYIVQEDNKFKRVELLSFGNFYNKTISSDNWLLFFSVFIDMLNSDLVNFRFIPRNIKITLSNEYLCKLFNIKENKLQFFEKYLKFLLTNKNSYYDYMSIGIEFSIGIGSLNYLYNEILSFNDNKNELINEFIYKLEPFIVKNKLIKNPDIISDKIVQKIIDFYSVNVKDDKILLQKLDIIICHFNIENIRYNEKIKDIILQKDLFSSMIYLYTKGYNNFIKPLNYLLNRFNNTKYLTFINNDSSDNSASTSTKSKGYYKDCYKNFIKDLKIGKINVENNLFCSKEFFGHFLLFFIQISTKKLFYPDFGKIPDNLHSIILPELFLFITKKNIVLEFIQFDSFSFFETLIHFFINKNNNDNSNTNILLTMNKTNLNKLKDNIKEYDNTNNIEEDIENQTNKIESYINKIIMNIINTCENCNTAKNNILIKFDLYFFIIIINNVINEIPLDIIIKSLIFIFTFHKEYNSIKQNLLASNYNNKNKVSEILENNDKFKCHYDLINKSQTRLDELSIIINESIKKNNTESNKNFLEKILKDGLSSPFIDVKIYLLELNKEYVYGIKAYLSENKKIAKKVFPFITKTLNYLKENGDETELQNFKKEIKENIPQLTKVSFAQSFIIIQKWFNSADEDIIKSLSTASKLQIKYLEKIRQNYKNVLLNNDSDNIKKEFSDILMIYIKILVKLKKNNKLLKLIKEEIEYLNINKCLEICKKNSIDVCVYLHKLNGDEKSALIALIDKIKIDYINIKKNMDNTYNYFSGIFSDIKNHIDECIKICELNAGKIKYKNTNGKNYLKHKNSTENEINLNNGEDLWLALFEQLYNILTDSEKRTQSIFIEINTYMKEKIENFLITMSFYVDFNFILKNKFNELKFPLLKKFLLKLFHTKTGLSNLYNSDICLLSDIIFKKFDLLKENNKRGFYVQLLKDKNFIEYNEISEVYDKTFGNNCKNTSNKDEDSYPNNIINRCCSCSKNINDEENESKENIIVFKCGHLYHFQCLNNYITKNNLNDYVCLLCNNIESEKCINSFTNYTSTDSIEERLQENKINFFKSKLFDNTEKKKIDYKKRLKKINKLDHEYLRQLEFLNSSV